MRYRLLILLAALPFHLQTADGGLEETVSFQLKQHLIVVRARIGKLEDIEFAIDTGASRSVISPGLARRLGLEASKTREVLILGKEKRIKEVELPVINLGTLRYDRATAWVSPLYTVPVDGLLGLDVLRRSNFTIDFEKRKIHFGRISLEGSAQSFVRQLPFLVARFRIGETTLSLLLDSGCGDLILFRRSIADSLTMEHTGQTITLDASGVAVRAELVGLKGLTLGRCRWNSLRAFLVDDRSTDRYGTLDGIMGLGSLNVRGLAFDFRHHRIVWQQ